MRLTPWNAIYVRCGQQYHGVGVQAGNVACVRRLFSPVCWPTNLAGGYDKGMTAQDAFHNWLLYCAVIAGTLLAITILFVVLTSSRERDEPR
jgi:hypothetical protein